MDILEFIRQVPIGVLLAPIVFGVLYIGLTVYIFRKARKRRSQKKNVFLGQQKAQSKIPLDGFLSGELPDTPNQPAGWTVPLELRDLPEPDLEMLSSPLAASELTDSMPPVNSDQANGATAYNTAPNGTANTVSDAAGGMPDSAANIEAKPAASTTAATSGLDWISSLVPPEDMAMGTTNTNNGMEPGTTPDTNSGDAVEVMRILRDLNDGRIIIQIGNQRYGALSEIRNPDLARRVATIARELWNMVSGGQNQPGQQPAPAVPANKQPGGMAARMGLLKSEPEAPPIPNMFKQVARPLGQSTARAPEQPGIANAIEDFLQFKLTQTPALAMRSIHIRTSHDHGVTIEVDGHYYDAIGDVVDADVREFLFALMREWEARH